MGSFSLTLFGLIGVAFGMNLTSSFEEVRPLSAKKIVPLLEFETVTFFVFKYAYMWDFFPRTLVFSGW